MSDGPDFLIDFVHGPEEVHMMTDTSARHALYFTSGALLTREALVATPIYLQEPDWRRSAT